VEDLDDGLARIVQGEAVEYARQYPMAIINARDISGPGDVMKPGAWTDVKMTVPSVDGLRQAFYDPESRIRLSTDEPRPAHAVMEALAWEGGFLDGVRLRLSAGFNVLIGGRGSGKSTVVESIRYLFDLDPPTDEMRRTHRGFVDSVLEPGTRVAALVCVPGPTAARYVIERTVPNPPTVRTADGQALAVQPGEIIGHLQVFGQREIAEYARQPGQRARLLERFITRDPGAVTRTASLRRALEHNRRRLDELADELTEAEVRLERLPWLREQQRRYEGGGWRRGPAHAAAANAGRYGGLENRSVTHRPVRGDVSRARR
jgi:energy-coupling factor transporter ATP-binding protein EcfA2